MAFVRRFAFTEEETRPLVERAQNPDYWRSLSPAMTIGSRATEIAREGSRYPDVDDALADYRSCGHCAVHGAFDAGSIDKLNSAVLAVHEAGWPMIFAFVYDQFWTIARTSKLDWFVSALLGPGYQTAISFWVNYVPTKRGGSGFTPHVDDVRPGHHSVTCWIPLTPATADNGCVYVIEKGTDNQALPETFVGVESFTAPQVASALAHVRALPVNPGSFLAWPNDTIHWGGMFLRGDQARMALSWHFTGADFENVDPDLSRALVPDQPLPEFEHRLRWLSQALLRFRGRDPALERFAPVARRLIHSSGA